MRTVGDRPPDVWAANADGSGQRRVLSARRDVEAEPAWSPVAPSTLAFIRETPTQRQEIYLGDLATGRLQRVTRHRAFTFVPSWSPDGRRIVYQTDKDFPPARNRDELPPPWEIYTIDPDGSNPTRMTHDRLYTIDPEYSPDGRQIVFSEARMRRGGLQNRLAIMDADGRNKRPLTNFGGPNEVNPEFMPDGSRIVFESFAIPATARTSPPSPRTAATGGCCSRHPPTRPTRFRRPTARGSPSRATATGAGASGWAPASSSTRWPSTARTSDGSPPIARPTSSPTGSACPRHRRTSRRERPTSRRCCLACRFGDHAGTASSLDEATQRRPVRRSVTTAISESETMRPRRAGDTASPPRQAAVHTVDTPVAPLPPSTERASVTPWVSWPPRPRARGRGRHNSPLLSQRASSFGSSITGSAGSSIRRDARLRPSEWLLGLDRVARHRTAQRQFPHDARRTVRRPRHGRRGLP
jgi:dipeptidyl aminopeptidase/acylaminoacyl peptidase